MRLSHKKKKIENKLIQKTKETWKQRRKRMKLLGKEKIVKRQQEEIKKTKVKEPQFIFDVVIIYDQ